MVLLVGRFGMEGFGVASVIFAPFWEAVCAVVSATTPVALKIITSRGQVMLV